MGQILLLHDQIACKCDAIWPDLEAPEWNYCRLWSKFYSFIRIKSIWGPGLDGHDLWRLCWVYTDTDGRFRYWCPQFIFWWPSAVSWGIFGAGDEFVLMMKDLCRQKKESITQPVRRAWGDDPATRHHEPSFYHHHQSSPKRFQWRLSPNESFVSLGVWAGAGVFSHVDYIQVWQWFVRAVSTDVDTGSIQSRISNRSNLNNRLTTLDALLLLIT